MRFFCIIIFIFSDREYTNQPGYNEPQLSYNEQKWPVPSSLLKLSLAVVCLDLNGYSYDTFYHNRIISFKKIIAIENITLSSVIV